jgi:putative ABC transport system permease protein
MFGIFIGIAAVISLIGLGEGLRIAITSQFGFLGTDVLSVRASGINFAGPPGQGVVEPLNGDLSEKISRISNVEAAFNRYIDSGTMRFNNHQEIGLFASVPHGKDRKIFNKIINFKVQQGRALKDTDNNKVVLGNHYFEDDHFGRKMSVGDIIFINDKKVEIIGFLEKKGSFIFDNMVFINEEYMIDYLGVDKDEADVIAVKVKDEGRIGRTKENIEKLLRKERDVKKGEENFEVNSPQNTIAALNSTLFAVQLFVYIIAAISLLVGGIGIMNTMYTSVLERTKEIGIMKSIGAKNSSIFTIFFIESGFLGVVGGVIGIIIGLIFAYGMAFIGRFFLGSELIQAHVSLTLIVSTLLFSFILGTLFGTLPALQASKLVPVESLRSIK